MNTPDAFMDARVAILGLGLIGGSLALALRGKCTGLVGADSNPQVVTLAEASGVVDQASTDPKVVLPQADLIVLAAPVGAILELLEKLADWHPGPAVVLDVGSSKSQIVAAMQTLPQRFDPLGGHPMCGKESASLANAEAGLFQGASFALTPLLRTSLQARSLAEQMVRTIGANPLWLDAELHDRWVAATSHVPYLVANALAYGLPDGSQSLVGPGLRSTTRLAVTPLSMMLDVLKTNRVNTVEALHRLSEHLDEIALQLEAEDWELLQSLLEQGGEKYAQWIVKKRE
jgi:prephenate dehydrogenase